MIDPRLVLLAFFVYMGFLFLIALWVEKKAEEGRSPSRYPMFYSLSLAVYATAWTYYGQVGIAATSGLLFLAVYLGPTVGIFLWWTVLRKLIRLKNKHRVTSIADFISVRYNKSQSIAVIVTLMALFGTMPYIALQLKAITSTFSLISTAVPLDPAGESFVTSMIREHVGPIVTFLMITFTIILGVRRLDPTERHEGMVAALVVECTVKLLAFLAAGVFVTYFLFSGFGDIAQRIMESPHGSIYQDGSLGLERTPYLTWGTHFILSMAAILFLPRQFHVAVVENSNENHIKTAMWALPLYLLLITIFVIPIAFGGLLKGLPVSEADTFVLMLPLMEGKAWLSLMVFIGGVSAAAGMVMIASVTMATMMTNHVFLPLVGRVPQLEFLKRHLLRCRWVAVAIVIGTGYWFMIAIGESYMLVNIGLKAFAMALQFAPPIIGGLFWRRGNKMGATWGLIAGFIMWFYTLLLPSFVKSGWMSPSFLLDGPWGIALLKPEAFLGLSLEDPLSHTVFWSLLLNISFYVLGSLLWTRSREEESLAQEFVDVLQVSAPVSRTQDRQARIELAEKSEDLERVLLQYFHPRDARAIITKCIEKTGLEGRETVSMAELLELQSEVEKSLAGSIGAASAYKAMSDGITLSPQESRELSEVYAETLKGLRITPGELKERVDYYQERETLLLQQAGELKEKVDALEREIAERQKVQKALQESESRYRSLVETMNEGLVIEDKTGKITYINNRVSEMWEWSPGEIIGRTLSDFLEDGQRELVEEKLGRRLFGEVVTCEVTWAGREGSKISTFVSAVPYLSVEGEYEGCFSVITDITPLKALEREKANIISMFAHDMRSSLVGIHGLGLRLLNKFSSMDDEKRNEYLQIINREASKLESLVDDFLEFSRLETGRLKLNFSPTSIEKELQELQEAYCEKTAQANVRMDLVIEEALPVIHADGNRLRRVFTNLLDNAIKFSRPNTTITIEAREVENGIEIKVRDQGVGIHPHEQPFIFDLFHRGKGDDKKDGYGIGLATVKAIVEGHGGKVHVTSQLNQGSEFTIFLPKVARGKDSCPL